jgi:hypothetical protein
MASPRLEKEMSQAARETARKTTEQTEGVVRNAADAGSEASRATADLFRRNTEALQQAWKSGSSLANQLTEQSLKWFTRPLGFSGEDAQRSAEQSARNVEPIAQSGTVLVGGIQTITREILDCSQKQLDQTFHRLDALVNCRTPFEIVAVQTDFARGNLEDIVQCARRIGETSIHIADEVARRMNVVSAAPR